MKEVEQQRCPHCGAELTQDEIAAQKCLRCMKPQESVPLPPPPPPPPPPPDTTFAAPRRTDESFKWDETPSGGFAVLGLIFFCVAFVWFIATVWINADILVSAHNNDMLTPLAKMQATTDFVDWTVIVLADIALILGICGYVKSSKRQKLAIVTMILSAGLFFALFCFKIREYTWRKFNNAIQEKFIQQPPPEIDFGDFD